MTDHRSKIEDLAADFEAHVNKGALKRAASLLPELVHSLLDMVEHHSGVGKASKAAVSTTKAAVADEADARASADSKLADEVKAAVAKVEDKIEAVVAKVEDNSAAIADAKASEVPAMADTKQVLIDEPNGTPDASDEAAEAADDKKPTKGKKKAD